MIMHANFALTNFYWLRNQTRLSQISFSDLISNLSPDMYHSVLVLELVFKTVLMNE
jgi:hypothetical protein